MHVFIKAFMSKFIYQPYTIMRRKAGVRFARPSPSILPSKRCRRRLSPFCWRRRWFRLVFFCRQLSRKENYTRFWRFISLFFWNGDRYAGNFLIIALLVGLLLLLDELLVLERLVGWGRAKLGDVLYQLPDPIRVVRVFFTEVVLRGVSECDEEIYD